MSDKIFKCKISDANIVKKLYEILQGTLTDVCFSYTKSGISLLTIDNKTPPQILIDLVLNADALDEYYCEKDLSIGINLQHKFKLLKSLKKKDSIGFFIERSNPDLLGIVNNQFETNQQIISYIKIQKISQIGTEIPDDYYHPIHISTSSYQKLCKDMKTMSPTKLTVYSNGTFLKFSCDMEGMYKHEIIFGDVNDKDNGEEYTDCFYTKNFCQFIKISDLNPRMQIYIPKNDAVPIKLMVGVGHIGKLSIYLKSISQIDSEL